VLDRSVARRAGSGWGGREAWRSRSRRRVSGLAWLAWLACLPLALGACTPDPEVEGYSKTPMARVTVERFLGALQREDFAAAAAYFEGPTAPLRDTYPDVPQGNTEELLARYVASQPAGIPPYRVIAAGMETPLCYPVEVEFSPRTEKEPYRQEFRVVYDGQTYRVLGLPGRPSPAAFSPAPAGG